ncbi:hypothetical protein [Spiroplasma endosymbiont of Dioctria linearis]
MDFAQESVSLKDSEILTKYNMYLTQDAKEGEKDSIIRLYIYQLYYKHF